ncbi:S-layer homology domain-containing protein [Cohnella sp. GCM10012308]|uniref:S-layer homology domain-containing protein n=1 Tax=Cohnella sp. GCM10012308 TaxID=3317329 RepID=UPI00360EB4C6
MNRRTLSAALRLVIAACMLLTGFPLNNALAGQPGPVQSVTTPALGSELSVSNGNLTDDGNGVYTLVPGGSTVTIYYQNDTNSSLTSEDAPGYQTVEHVGDQPSSMNWTWGSYSPRSVDASLDIEDGTAQDIYFQMGNGPGLEKILVKVRFASVPVTATTNANAYNTDTSAFFSGTANNAPALTPVGFEYSKDANFANSETTEEHQTSQSNNSIYGSVSNLERGTTYHYRAYAKVDGTTIYGETKSLKTAAMTALDVKDAGGTTLTKSPAAFSYGTAAYEVHVPNSTTTVSVAATVDLGTAMDVQDLDFKVGGIAASESWEPSGTTQTSTRQVSITADTTTVCVAYPSFTGPATIPNACGLKQFEIKIVRDAAPTVTTNANAYNTDTSAFFSGAANNSPALTQVGFEYSKDASFATFETTEEHQTSQSNNSIYGSVSNLERGTTYYYRAYAEVGGTTIYGETKSLKTAAMTALDVKDAGGTTLTKSPAAFSYDTAAYEVHVPNSTTTVSVAATVDLGTAMDVQDLDFKVGGITASESWEPSGTTQTSTRQVSITADTTTVCVAYPSFTGPATIPNACGLKQFEVKIVRDAAQVVPPTVTTNAEAYNTDTSAFFAGTANNVAALTLVGFEYSKDESFANFDTTVELPLPLSADIHGSAENLERGTTYYYRAYAKVDGSTIYGETQSFKTATITALDVKNEGGTTLTKSPATFSYGTTTYEVHVPNSTTSVSVAETVDLGTATALQNLKFVVDGNSATEPWVSSGTNRTSTRQVDITKDSTTVCVSYPVFTGLGAASGGACDPQQFEVKIIRDAAQVVPPTVTTNANAYNTDTEAFFTGSVYDAAALTPVGFEYSKEANFANYATTEERELQQSSNSIYGSVLNLERGTTYYFRAYAEVAGTKVYGNTQTFKTATITALDVKDAGGTVLTKSPAAFSYGTTTYEVHVPNSTTSVSVVQTVDLGTAMDVMKLDFGVDGNTTAESWVSSGTSRTATHQVAIAADTTTVCVASPIFTGPATMAGACGPEQYEVKIIRDAAQPVVNNPAPATTTTTLVLDSNPSEINQSAKAAITRIVGSNLSLSATLKTQDGKPLSIPDITIGADGSFNLTNVPAGVYKVNLNLVAPTGEKLVGGAGKLTVNNDGTAKLEAGLIDPYGIVTDSVTEQTIDGATVTLYWADTELNRSKGRTPGTMVVLPELPDFAPNKNRDPQSTVNGGQYGWMVFPEGDYYILAEKDGYDTFDSRKDTRDEQQGDDSYIKNGNIHVGQSIVHYSFAMQPTVVDSGNHKPYMVGYPDGSFLPERGMTRAETAAILSRLFADAAGQTTSASFSDVKGTHWAAKAIAFVTKQKWMVGYPDGTFRPNQQVTRAELAQILLNVKKWSNESENAFADAKGHWAEKAIGILQQQGLISGYPDGTFRPNAPIKRVEADVIFNQLTGRKPWSVPAVQKWTDVAPDYWGYNAVMEASVPHAYEVFESGIENWTSH